MLTSLNRRARFSFFYSSVWLALREKSQKFLHSGSECSSWRRSCLCYSCLNLSVTISAAPSKMVGGALCG